MRRWHPNAILDEIDFAPGVLRRHSGPAVVDRDEANRDGKRKDARPHEITPTRYRRMPAAQQAARVKAITSRRDARISSTLCCTSTSPGGLRRSVAAALSPATIE